MSTTKISQPETSFNFDPNFFLTAKRLTPH